MRELYIFNVGFGDCFIIKDEQTSFLIDCGGMGSKISDNIIDDIKSKLGNDNYLLITHFHQDHYNLIDKLEDVKFKKIFLRNIYDNNFVTQLSFIDLIAYADKSEKWQEALYSIMALHNLQDKLDDNGEFVFVKEGANIIVGNTVYNILSPFKDIKYYADINIEANLLTEYLEKFGSETDSNLYRMLDHYNSNIKEAIQYSSIQVDGIIGEQQKLRKDVFWKLNSNFVYLDKNIIEFKSHFDSLKTILTNENVDTIDEKDTQIFKKLSSIIKRGSNKEHIFNICLKDNDNNILMLGDERPEDVDYIISNNNLLNFKIIKAPHHGTKNYIFNHSIKGCYALISHSKFRNYNDVDCLFYKNICKCCIGTNCNNTYSTCKDKMHICCSPIAAKYHKIIF